MRDVHRRQFRLDEVPVEQIWLDPKSRDDIPAVLKGLQHIWSDEALRARLFALLEEHVQPEVDHTRSDVRGWPCGRSWCWGSSSRAWAATSTVFTTFANHHEKVRAFLGHSDFGDETYYECQTVRDNVSLLTPDLLSAVGQLVVESGHKVAKKSLASHCAGGVTRSWWRRTCTTRRT